MVRIVGFPLRMLAGSTAVALLAGCPPGVRVYDMTRIQAGSQGPGLAYPPDGAPTPQPAPAASPASAPGSDSFEPWILGKRLYNLSQDLKTVTMSLDVASGGAPLAIEWSQEGDYGTFNSSTGRDVQWHLQRDAGTFVANITVTVRKVGKDAGPIAKATFQIPVVEGRIDVPEIFPELSVFPQSTVLFRPLPFAIGGSRDSLAVLGIKDRVQLTVTTYIYDKGTNSKKKTTGDIAETRFEPQAADLVVVDDLGLVRPADGSATGSAVVYVTSKSNAQSRVAARVQVHYLATRITLRYPATSLYLPGQGTSAMKLGATVQYTNPLDRDRVVFTDPDGRELTWSTSDPDVAQVDAGGNLSVLPDAKPGTVKVVARSNYDPSVAAELTIRIGGTPGGFAASAAATPGPVATPAPSAAPSAPPSPKPPTPTPTPLAYVATLAGGYAGHGDGDGTVARFSGPVGLAVGPDGFLYVADAGNSAIRRVSLGGSVSTLAGQNGAGHADGSCYQARFRNPTALAFGPTGELYVADTDNNRVRLIDLPSCTVSTLAGSATSGYADGYRSAARLSAPTAIAWWNDALVVAEGGQDRLRRVTPQGYVTSLGSGGSSGFKDGYLSQATFQGLNCLTAASAGRLYLAANNALRAIDSYWLATLAGSGAAGFKDGEGATAQFNTPWGAAVGSNDTVYLADKRNNRIRAIRADGSVATLAGTGLPGTVDGYGDAARFNGPTGLAFKNETLYVADTGSNRIRSIRLR